jgi:hypothetical protein
METAPPGIVSTPVLDLGHYITGIISFFTGNSGNFWESSQNLVGAIVGISIPVFVFFFIAIIFTVEGIKHIRNLEDERFNKPAPDEAKGEKVDGELAKRWRKVVEYTESNNPNDWKQAIIEADIMLDQLLTKLGYQGATIGEKLMRVTRGDFKTLTQAWDAHNVRNRIAHESGYEINQLEARETIGFYRQVFDEFYHISEK